MRPNAAEKTQLSRHAAADRGFSGSVDLDLVADAATKQDGSRRESLFHVYA